MTDILVTLFGPLDTVVGPYAGYVVVAFALLTMLTRRIQHARVRRQANADEDEPTLTRHPVHSVAMGLFVLSTFYYLTLHHHSGVVLTVMVVGTLVADVFEFEARRVEVRQGYALGRPSGAIFVGTIALLYAAYVTLFYIVNPYWQQVV